MKENTYVDVSQVRYSFLDSFGFRHYPSKTYKELSIKKAQTNFDEYLVDGRFQPGLVFSYSVIVLLFEWLVL